MGRVCFSPSFFGESTELLTFRGPWSLSSARSPAGKRPGVWEARGVPEIMPLVDKRWLGAAVTVAGFFPVR